MLTSLRSLYLRDLDKLEKEISSYNDEKSVWEVNGTISNSAGNLTLHICGNLQHFIGGVLGGSGYVREREKEFTTKGLSIKALVEQIESTKKSIEQAFLLLEKVDITENYPLEVFGHAMTIEYFLLHLLSHLNYHLGQVNYHRRLV